VSSSTTGGQTGPRPHADISPDGFVAVLRRRARFLVAEPLFDDRGGERRSRSVRGPVTIATPRGARRGQLAAGAGDLVLVRAGGRRGGARVLRRIGRPDVARDVIEALLLERGAVRSFDAAVSQEADDARERSLADAQRDVRDGRRRDLRGLATFTIDPASARDFDDAISAEAHGDGARRVWVHIADVAAHVAEGSAVDREARRRALSVYVPSAVEPMLPSALCDDACSLLPGAERPAVTVELELRGGDVVRAGFFRSLIRSDARLDYEHVDRIFAGAESAHEPWAEPLKVSREAARDLRAAREQGGTLQVDAGEPQFTFDQQGHVEQISVRRQTESHRLIEQLMIAANEAVAELLSQRALACLYRVHERPDPQRIEHLVDQLASLQVATPPLPDPLSSTQAAEALGPISRLVEEHVRRTGRGGVALRALILRSLKQAYYSPSNIGHAGLRSRAYCHFTSPIRRYPDLVCHRSLLSAIGADEPSPRAADLAELGTWVSARERSAMETERDADDVARCFALERELFEGGWDQMFDGEIVGLIGAGAFATFGGSNGRRYEGLLPVRHIAPPASPVARAPRGRATDRAAEGGRRDWWELNEQGTIMRGERSGATLRLGDSIAVRVERVEPARGRADLLMGDAEGGGQR
jgi:ribonuclease R